MWETFSFSHLSKFDIQSLIGSHVDFNMEVVIILYTVNHVWTLFTTSCFFMFLIMYVSGWINTMSCSLFLLNRKPRRDENLSEEAAKVIASLPDLSFMHAKVLMFPVSLTPLTSSQDKVDWSDKGKEKSKKHWMFYIQTF